MFHVESLFFRFQCVLLLVLAVIIFRSAATFSAERKREFDRKIHYHCVGLSCGINCNTLVKVYRARTCLPPLCSCSRQIYAIRCTSESTFVVVIAFVCPVQCSFDALLLCSTKELESTSTKSEIRKKKKTNVIVAQKQKICILNDSACVNVCDQIKEIFYRLLCFCRVHILRVYVHLSLAI